MYAVSLFILVLLSLDNTYTMCYTRAIEERMCNERGNQMKHPRTVAEERQIVRTVRRILAEQHLDDNDAELAEFWLLQLALCNDTYHHERLQPVDATVLRLLDAGGLLLASETLDDCAIQLFNTDLSDFWSPISGCVVERLVAHHALTPMGRSATDIHSTYYRYMGGLERVQKLEARFDREMEIGWENVPDDF